MKKPIIIATVVSFILAGLSLHFLNGCQKDVESIHFPFIYDEDKPEISTEKLNYVAELTFLDNSSNLSYEMLRKSYGDIAANFCENAEICDSICFYWDGADNIENFFDLKIEYESLSEHFAILARNISTQDKCTEELIKISTSYFEIGDLYSLYGYEWLVRSMEECGEEYIHFANIIESDNDDSIKSILSTISSLQASFGSIFQVEKTGITYEMLLNGIDNSEAKSTRGNTKAGSCPKCKTPVTENNFIQYDKVRVYYEYYLTGPTHTVYKQWECRTPCHFFAWCSACRCQYEAYLNKCNPTQSSRHLCEQETCKLISSNIRVEDGSNPPNPTVTVVITSITPTKSRSAGLATKSSCPCINCEPDPNCHEGGGGN